MTSATAAPLPKTDLPFLVMHAKQGTRIGVERAVDDDSSQGERSRTINLVFSAPYQIHDDGDVLQRLYEQHEAAKTAPPPLPTPAKGAKGVKGAKGAKSAKDKKAAAVPAAAAAAASGTSFVPLPLPAGLDVFLQKNAPLLAFAPAAPTAPAAPIAPPAAPVAPQAAPVAPHAAPMAAPPAPAAPTALVASGVSNGRAASPFAGGSELALAPQLVPPAKSGARVGQPI